MNKKRIGTSIICFVLLIVSMFALSACGGKVNNFKLSFKVDSEVYQTITTTGNESITIPENPTKTGYEFDGWFWDKDVWSKPFTANSLLDAPISSDMSVYAKFNAIEYDITYNLDGGTHNNPLSYTIEDSIVLSDAEKTGYSFVGWYSDSNYNTKVETISAGITGDITLYAKFEIENYTISYTNIKDVVNSNPTSYNVNSDTIILINLSKNGYTFDGWYNGEEKVTEIAKGSTGNLTLEARWNAIEYEVIYHNINGATNSNPENYNVEEQPLVLVDLEKAGYNFLGWFTDENFTNEITEISVGATCEINLYAKWEIIEYTATFMDGTTVVKEINFTVETESVDEPTVPNHVGYNGEWEDYELTLEDITIDAVYTAIEYTATFMDGTTVVKEVKFTVETESIEEPTVPVRIGYNGEWEDYELTLEDITIDAVYTAIEYTATFMDGTTTVEEIKFTVETESIDEPAVPNHVGYTGEWEEYTLGAEDITIDAVYTVITYNIEYLDTKDVKSENPKSYTIESATIILDNISKKGYQFEGWYNNVGNKVEIIEKGSHGDLTLTARWTTLTYTITYLYDNAYGDVEEGKNLKTSYTVEDEFTFEELVCKNEGFNFRGWFTEKNVGTGDKVLGVDKGTTGSFTVYAQFGLEVYDITYINVNGAINNNPTYYDVETEDFTIYPLSKEGYNFDGWFTNEEYTEEANLTIVKGSNGDITLYAKWTAITYIIEYVTYGGSFENNNYPESYTINDEISLVEPTLSNNFFVGWFTLAENGKLQEKIEKGSTGNVTLYARWISFESNGGSTVEYEVSIEKNKFNEPVKINQPVAPEKDYYTFEGWYTNEELTNKFDFAIPSKNLVLYANWEATEYKINYVLNGGKNAEENQETYTIEEKVIFADASKTGYGFVGWFTDEDFTSTVVKELPLGSHGEITLYAHYSINKYTISFETNGGTSVTAITQNYATEVAVPEAPAKNGYEFGGWYANEELTRKYTFSTMPAEDITLYAKWDIVTYDIVYNLDGGKFVDNTYAKTYRIDSEDIILKTPTKLGYKFDGWYTDENCTEIITEITKGSYGDLELFAKWTVIEYTITYITPDGTINNNITTYTIETDLTTLTNASVKGYDFIGWFSDKDFTTAITTIGGGETGDKTIYGKFDPATYNVWLDGNEEAKCVVSFNLNGADGSLADQTITPTETLKYPTNPTRTGYIFGGWYDNEDCEGSNFDFTAIVTSNTTLYAKWVKIENATAIAINGSANITLNGKTEQKLMFVPLVSGNITITSSGSYDTLGVLYNADMVALIQDDDTASDGINFHIVYNVTAGKVYYIGARAFSSTTTGSATVSISGNTTVLDGGYTINASKDTVIYGSNFTLKLPEAREGYKFLGYADENGVMYTDSTGASVKVWDKDQDTTLYSVWEKMVYTVAFETSGGSPIESIELAFGERLDIGKYVTTRTGYTFNGWYYNGVEYNATTMPDYNITLIAYWKTFALGTIKYDTDKKAVSVNDEITPELFDAICLDTNGDLANFSVIISGKQEIGETISVRLVATSGNKTKQVTITDVKVYGMPTLTFDNTVDYVNVNGGLTASHFSASGTDSFGQATKIDVYIDGEYEEGQLVTVTIASIDPAGNAVYGYVENVKAYGLPVITYNQNKAAISVNDTLNAELFSATAKDSFGEVVEVSVKIVDVVSGFANGEVYSYKTSTIKDYKYFTALNSETYTLHYKNGASGGRTYIMVYCVTTSSTVKSASYYTNYSSYSTLTFSVTSGYEYYICTYAYSSSYTTNFSMYLTCPSKAFGAGTIATIRLSATDSKGNITNIDVECKVYGAPTIADSTVTEIKLSDNISAELLGISAVDTYGENLDIAFIYNEKVAGEVLTVTAKVVDVAGNVTTKKFGLKVYGPPIITYDRLGLKANEDPEKDSSLLNARAIDSFGELIAVTVKLKFGRLNSGDCVVYSLSATDHLGNVTTIDTDEIGVYDINDIKLTYNAGMSNIIKLSSKGEEFNASATDSFGMICDISIESAEGYNLVGGNIISLYIVATDKAGNKVYSDMINDIKVYGIPTIIFNQDNYVVSEDTDISFLFTVYDSFGEELYAEIEIIGEQKAGNIVTIIVRAVDDANNVIVKEYNLGVQPSKKSFVELYKDDELWQVLFVDDASNYVLPLPLIDEGLEAFWAEKNGVKYTDTTGKGILALPQNIQLHCIIYKKGYTPIYTIPQLNSVSVDGLYYLIKDLDLKGDNWTPLGTREKPFKGVFDGNSKTISNFKIVGSKYYGFFGYNIGTIENLCVRNFDSNIKLTTSYEQSYIGGMVGYNGGVILNCVSEGNLVFSSTIAATYSNGNVRGGLVGFNHGLIKYSSSSVCVKSTGGKNSSPVGGLVGENQGAIVACFVTGEVFSSDKSSDIGGLVGVNFGEILNSYSKAKVVSNVSGRSNAGGLVGINQSGSLIVNCYSIENISSTSASNTSYAGGLVGFNIGSIANCYSVGDVTSTSSGTSNYAGGLIGAVNAHNDGTVTNSYRSSSQKVIVKKGTSVYAATNNIGTSTKLENLYSQIWAKGNLWSTEIEVWDFSTGFPTLNYDIIVGDTVKISTKEDLLALQGNVIIRNYILTNDIELKGFVWEPILFFSGNFMGNGYSIGNFQVESSTNFAGLFGINHGVIKNLGIKSVQIKNYYSSDDSYNGGLVAYNGVGGIVERCYVIGNIEAHPGENNSYVGGLVGFNESGTLTECFARCSISSINRGPYNSVFAGGLVGRDEGGVVLNCYSLGDVNCVTDDDGFAGGLIGYTDPNGFVINCYAVGNVNCEVGASSSYVGGLIGLNNATIENCYATGNLSSNSSYSNTTYIGGLVGSSSQEKIINSFCCSEQKYEVWRNDNITCIATNNYVNAIDMDKLQSVDFSLLTLGWSTDVWNIVVGINPALKNVGTIN